MLKNDFFPFEQECAQKDLTSSMIDLICPINRIDQNQERRAGLSLMGGSFQLCRSRHFQIKKFYTVQCTKLIKNTKLIKTWFVTDGWVFQTLQVTTLPNQEDKSSAKLYIIKKVDWMEEEQDLA